MLPLRNMSYQPEMCSAGTLNVVEALADVERRPIFAGLVVVEPIEHVLRHAFAVQARDARGTAARWFAQARFAQACSSRSLASRSRLRRASAFSICRPQPSVDGQAQRAVVIKPAVVEIASRHARARCIASPSGCSAAARSCVMPW